jgi:sorbose reductase
MSHQNVRSAFELTGRNYIVTGGAQGIGFTISRAICEMGGNAAIWDIQEKPVDQKEFDSWSSTFGSKTLYVQADVTKQDSLEAAFKKTLEVFQTVDGCVPSAGIAIDKPFIDQTWEEFTRIQEINVRLKAKQCQIESVFTDVLPRYAAHSSQPKWSPDT